MITVLEKHPCIMTPEMVADVLHVSRKKVLQMVRAGDIRGTRIGKAYRILREDLEIFIYRSRETTNAATLHEGECVTMDAPENPADPEMAQKALRNRKK